MKNRETTTNCVREGPVHYIAKVAMAYGQASVKILYHIGGKKKVTHYCFHLKSSVRSKLDKHWR